MSVFVHAQQLDAQGLKTVQAGGGVKIEPKIKGIFQILS